MNKTNRIPTPRKTFFFERKDGSVFAAEEREADMIVREDRFKLVGVSDGIEFARKLSELQREYEQRKKDGVPEEELEEYRISEMLRFEKEEIELARGRIEKPRDFTKTDMSGNPIRFSL